MAISVLIHTPGASVPFWLNIHRIDEIWKRWRSDCPYNVFRYCTKSGLVLNINLSYYTYNANDTLT